MVDLWQYVHNANFIWQKGREIEEEHKWLWRMPPYLSELWPWRKQMNTVNLFFIQFLLVVLEDVYLYLGLLS